MFSYARRCLTSRPALWAASLVCALLLALPGALVATLFIQPVTMLVLTGDFLLALDLVPETLTEGRWARLLIAGLLVGPWLLGVAYNRVYALLLWESDESNETGWRTSWVATRGRWRKVLALNAAFLLALIVALGIVIGLIRLTLNSPGAAALILLGGVSTVAILRTIGRIFVTLAARAAVLDDRALRDAWKEARSIVKERRRQVVAAWSMLLAAGAALWLGGRVITPILQDTALDYPALSAYTFAREGAQLAYAIPLEAFQMVFASAIWTAVYRDIETEATPEATPPTTTPWLPRALAGLVVLVIVGNGIPAFIDVAWSKEQDDEIAAIRSREIAPEDVVRPTGASQSGDRNTYSVSAGLDGELLEWSTTISYTNRTARTVREIPVYVYPAAYERDVEAMPLADDVLSSSVPAGVRALVEPGSFNVEDVALVSGERLGWTLNGTLLRVELAGPLVPQADVRFDVDLAAELPVWPMRYGIWNDLVQLGNWIPTVAVDRPAGFITHPYGSIGDPFFARSADYDVRLEVDDEIRIVGSGRLEEIDQITDDRRVWRFTGRDMRDAAFTAGRTLRGLEGIAQGMRVRAWYSGDEALAGNELLDEAVSSITNYTLDYGRPSFDEVDLVFTDNPLGGMEYPGLVYVSAGFPQLEGIPFLPELVAHSGFETELQRYIAGHELAHQWWYADVGNDQVLEPWLDEAFAEASTRLWLREKDGDDRTWKIAHSERSVPPRPGVLNSATGDFDSNADYSDAIYEAGSAVLLELRHTIGARSYNRLMFEWHQRFANRIATVDDFIELSEEVGGSEARALLERYRK